jgi:hypothetical protein
MDTPTTTTVSLAEFGRMVGRSRSSIHELVRRGKLTAINGRIHPALGLVEFEKVRPRAIVESTPPPAAPDGSTAGDYGSARAARERAEAGLAELRLQRELGAMLDRDDVLTVVADVATTVRVALEEMPNRLAARLVGRSEHEIAALLTEEVRRILESLSLGFERIAAESRGSAR